MIDDNKKIKKELQLIKVIASCLYESMKEEFFNLPGLSASINTPYESLDATDKDKYVHAALCAFHSLKCNKPIYVSILLQEQEDKDKDINDYI